MSDLFPSFFDGRKSPMPPAASAASAARGLCEDDLQRMQQVQQLAMAEFGDGAPRAADAASAAGHGRENQAYPKAANVLAVTARTAPSPQRTVSAPAWETRAASLEHDAGLPHDSWPSRSLASCAARRRAASNLAAGRGVVQGASIFAEQWGCPSLPPWMASTRDVWPR